MHLPVRANSSD